VVCGLTEELCTTNDLIEELGISRSSLHRYRQEGLPYQKVGGKVLFDLDEVKEWFRSSKKKNERSINPVIRKSSFTNDIYKVEAMGMALYGHLPDFPELKGSLGVEFENYDILVSLGHEEIINVLAKNMETDIKDEERTYLLKNHDKNKYNVYLNGVVLVDLDYESATKLCEMLDDFVVEYITKLQGLLDRINPDRFPSSQERNMTFKLLKINRQLWKEMIGFTKAFDYEEAENKKSSLERQWCMFDFNENFIKVVTKGHEDYDDGYHVFLEPEQVQNIGREFMKSDNEMWISARLSHNKLGGWSEIEDINDRKVWSLQKTHSWLVGGFIPTVVEYHKESEIKEKNDSETFLNKLISAFSDSSRKYVPEPSDFGGFIVESPIIEKIPHPSSVKDLEGLEHFISKLQQFYARYSWVLPFKSEDITKLYKAVLMCLDFVDENELEYVRSTIGLGDLDSNSLEKIKDGIEQMIPNLTDGAYSTSSLEFVMRCLIVQDYKTKGDMDDESISVITEYLKPFYEKIQFVHEIKYIQSLNL